MLFTAFPGPELVDQEKFSKKNEIYDLEITIFISVKSFIFFQTEIQSERAYESLMTDGLQIAVKKN